MKYGRRTGAPVVELPPNACCPECGAAQVHGLRIRGTILAGCSDCRALWEALPPDAPEDIGVTPQPFRKSCDNCAFHKNSPERSDPEKWQALQEAFAYRETPFYCHKGMPIQAEGEDWPTDHGFKYPLTPDGRPDRSRLRLCAGFIAWWRAISPDPVPGMNSPA